MLTPAVQTCRRVCTGGSSSTCVSCTACISCPVLRAGHLSLQVLNVVIPRPGQGGAPDPPGVGKVIWV